MKKKLLISVTSIFAATLSLTFGADSDGDGLDDSVETNTGIYLSETDTGTDPNNSDTDGDGLIDSLETNTGILVSSSFDFTSAEGFTGSPANLNGQNGWSANPGSVLVNTDASKEFVFCAGGQGVWWEGGTFNPTAGTMTFVTDFKFNNLPAATGDAFNVIKLGAEQTGNDVARVYFRYVSGPGNYRMRYSRGNGYDLDVGTSNTFDLSDIGQGSEDAESDELRLTWTLTRGETADAWTSSLSLVNLTTEGTIVGLGYGTDAWERTVAVSETFHNDTSINWGFQTSNINNANILATSASFETNTGVVFTSSNTGTDPNNADSDSDGLTDGVENNTGTFVSTSEPGTDPNNADTSGDGIKDGDWANADYDPNANYSEIINIVSQYPSLLGLVDPSSIVDGQIGSLGIQQGNDGNFDMNFDLELSSDLQTWTPHTSHTIEVSVPDQSKTFMRLNVQ